MPHLTDLKVFTDVAQLIV